MWSLLDDALGRGQAGQIVSLGAGALVYGAAIVLLRIPEAAQITRLLRRGA